MVPFVTEYSQGLLVLKLRHCQSDLRVQPLNGWIRACVHSRLKQDVPLLDPPCHVSVQGVPVGRLWVWQVRGRRRGGEERRRRGRVEHAWSGDACGTGGVVGLGGA